MDGQFELGIRVGLGWVVSPGIDAPAWGYAPIAS